MQDADTTAPEALSQVRSLHDRGLYRQALAAGESAWGPLRGWRDPEACLLGARLAYQLGLPRTQAAILMATWRRHPSRADVRHAAVRGLLNHRGPWAAWQAWERIGPVLTEDPALQAEWMALRAIIFGAYRDWERADDMLREAIAVSPDPRDFDLERCWLLQSQDRYDEALSVILPAAGEAGIRQRVSMQRAAGLLEISGRADEAITLLHDGLQRFESVDLGMQLHGLLVDRDRHAESDACLSRVEAWLPGDDTWLGESVRAARFQSLYQRGDLAAARRVLEGARSRYFRQVRDNLDSAGEDATARLLDVPFIRQHRMTCAPATFAAICRFHGDPVDHLAVAAAICYDGTPALAERQWAESRGWAVREFELNLDDIRLLVDAGCPVGLVTVEPGSAHMQAIIGYDTRRGIYLLRDPFMPRVQELLIEGAHEAYASSGPRCMVFVPAARADWLRSLPLRHAALYDQYYALQAALDRHDRDAAVAALSRLAADAPAHRLTWWARRGLAAYDNDVHANLAAVDALLASYPEDLNLLVSRARLLAELGKTRDRLQFLRDCRERGIDHSYLLQELADGLAQDHREATATGRLLALILRRNPMSASALWTLAGQRWESGDRAGACELYRLCLCLEDKTEGYADSYFKASRFLRRTDEALAMLRRRVLHLGDRAPYAHITLARALDLLGETAAARDTLEEALQRHPRDAWLLAEAVDMLLATGEDRRAERLLAEHGTALAPVMRLQKMAAIAGFRGDAARQLSLYAEVLVAQPLHPGAIVATATILSSTRSPEAAIAFLEGHLEANPFNTWLMREKLDHVRELPVLARMPHLQAMLQRHPDDPNLLEAQAAVLAAQGDHEGAVAQLRKAIGVDPDEAWLHRSLGSALAAAGRVEDARDAYRTAISLSVDTAGVFEALLATWPGFEGRRDALAFIHGELMAQVSFGNGILEFQELARRYLEDARVQAFLEEAVRLRPDLWQSWAGLTRFRLEINNARRALDCANDMVARFPLLPRVYLERAAVHRVLGDLQAAIDDLRQSVAINPRFADAVTRLIDALEAIGDAAGAMDELDRALLRLPRHVPLHGYRAEALWRRGDRAAAIDGVEAALRWWPQYGWAWSSLVSWCQAVGEPARPLRVARELADLHPDNGELWKRLAEVTSDPAERAGHLERAIACDPRNSDFLLARCRLMAERGDIAGARARIAQRFADAEKPSEIRGFEAILTQRTGRRDEAIQAMESVVASDPAYYPGWNLLSQWYVEAGRREDALRAVRQCVQLYPQSPSALVAAAELFLAQMGDDKELAREAREYLERALRQQHSDSYIFLTLVDLYFDNEDLAAIRVLFDRGWVDVRDPYVRAREARLLLGEKRLKEALASYDALLDTMPDNDWLLFVPYGWFVAAGEGDVVRARIGLRVERADSALPLARLWMRSLVDAHQDRLDPFVRAVRKAEAVAVPAFWEEGVAWLYRQRGERAVHANALQFGMGNALDRRPRIWPALVYAAIDAENFNELRRLSRFAPADAPARALYFCAVAWRESGNHAEASRLVAQACTRPPDDSRDNLRLWLLVDGLCASERKPFDDAVYASIDLRELPPVEKMLYDMVSVMQALPDDTGGLDLKATALAFRRAMAAHGEMARHPLGRRIRRLFAQALARRDRAPSWRWPLRWLGWHWALLPQRPAQSAVPLR